jgi:hypothetical protein
MEKYVSRPQDFPAAERILGKFRAVGLKVIPGLAGSATLRGPAWAGRDDFIRENLPTLKRYWLEVVEILESKQKPA